jgi:hypothetical protein
MSHSSQQSAVQRSSSTGNPSLTNRLFAVAGSVALGLLVFVSMTGIVQASHHHNNPAATPATQLTDADGNVFTLADSFVSENGTPVQTPATVADLMKSRNHIFAMTSDGHWLRWSNSSTRFVAVKGKHQLAKFHKAAQKECRTSGGSNCIVDPTTTSSATTSANPIALVFRDNNGPAGCVDCSAGAATLLRSDRNYHFDVRFVGPHETLSVQAGLTLPNVAIFVQPGGKGDVNQAFAEMAKDAPAIINFVKNGGMYLGFCEGGYLAGTDPGYNLLSQVGGDTDEYITSPQAVVTTDINTEIPIIWRGVTREVFFQDGNFFTFSDGQGTPTERATAGGATVLATYTNGEVAAVVAPYGKGIVAASGPHPEATLTWFKKYHLTPQSTADLGHDLVDTAMALRR